jgi:Protein of unknown function (DUF2778)
MTITASACYGIARQSPKNTPRKAASYSFYGSAAVACLVIACGWTVYSNIFAGGIYPTVDGGNTNVAVGQRMSAPGRTAAASQSSVIVESQRSASAAADSASFSDRFATPSFSFNDRFGAAAPQSVAAAPQPAQQQVASLAPAAPVVERRVAEAVPMPTGRPKNSGASVRDMAQRAKSAMMSVASNDKSDAPAKPPTIFEKLFGKFESAVSTSGSTLAYASADTSSTGSLAPASTNIASVGTGALYDRQTAVYDISAHMVYLPDGTKLEAHSGLGSSLDDPRSANIKMRGVTPPHLYDLKPREAMFHGVAALRLNPVGGEASIYGRAGLLAHTFMLGPNGDSNGCVSFRDYNAFLDAYRNKGVRRLAVVARL